MIIAPGGAAVIAIDGPAAAGKGTLARRLAKHLGYAYLDSGLLYRAVGWRVLQQGASPADPGIALAAAEALRPEDLDNPDLRNDDVAMAASQVAAIPAVRAALLDFQRDFAHRPPAPAAGAVLDGRDIGTVVCPDAPIKLFVTASLEARAGRRLKELQDRGIESIHTRVLEDMKNRDERDSKRDVAPLAPAADAFVLDTTALDADAAFTAALDFISRRNDTLKV